MKIDFLQHTSTQKTRQCCLQNFSGKSWAFWKIRFFRKGLKTNTLSNSQNFTPLSKAKNSTEYGKIQRQKRLDGSRHFCRFHFCVPSTTFPAFVNTATTNCTHRLLGACFFTNPAISPRTAQKTSLPTNSLCFVGVLCLQDFALQTPP